MCGLGRCSHADERTSQHSLSGTHPRSNRQQPKTAQHSLRAAGLRGRRVLSGQNCSESAARQGRTACTPPAKRRVHDEAARGSVAEHRRGAAPDTISLMVPEEFTIQRISEDRHCTLILAGQLDLASAPTLEEMIVGLCADGTRELVLRLDDLTHFDRTGLRLLLHGRELCAAHGGELHIVPVGRGAAEASSNERRSEKRRRWRKMPAVRRSERLPDAVRDDRKPSR